jgi:hypothetical protein
MRRYLLTCDNADCPEEWLLPEPNRTIVIDLTKSKKDQTLRPLNWYGTHPDNWVSVEVGEQSQEFCSQECLASYIAQQPHGLSGFGHWRHDDEPHLINDKRGKIVNGRLVKQEAAAAG